MSLARTNWKGIPSTFDEPFPDGRPYDPEPKIPLVYHLFGRDEAPASLVLTEDDHLEFLTATYQDRGRGTDPIHSRVRRAMSFPR